MSWKWIALMVVLSVSSQLWAQEREGLRTPNEKTSYALGVDMGATLKRQRIEIDADVFTKGLRDMLSGQKLLMTDDEVRKAVIQFQTEQRLKQRQMRGPAPASGQEGKGQENPASQPTGPQP